MKTKIILPFLVLFAVLMSCNKGIIEKPNNLIEQDKMVDIMYDLSLLSAIKVQQSSMPNAQTINSNEYIYKKYKIDSLQFVKSNIYYASDSKEYEKMVKKIKARIDKNKDLAENLNKIQAKKDQLLKKKQEKLKLKREKDSIAKVKNELKKIETDSIKKTDIKAWKWPINTVEYLKIQHLK
jgi:transcriptional regulator with PAS, ATPase and Fis domain